MKQPSSFMEIRKRGSLNDCFEKYHVVYDRTKLFVANHWHHETEILYVTNGCIQLTINHKSFVGQPGDIFIINSGEMHEIYGDGAPLDYTAFVFDFDILSFSKHDFAEQTFIEPLLRQEIQFVNRVHTSEKMLDILQQLSEIHTQKSECYMLFTKALLVQFVARLIEEKQIVFLQNPTLDTEKKQLLKNIVTYINENYAQKIALADIAEQFHMSPKYFCRFFKKNFNKTLVEYINDVRIERSLPLLERQNVPITEVAVACGFYNMSYFAHSFKKKMGCTPSQYKKQGGR